LLQSFFSQKVCNDPPSQTYERYDLEESLVGHVCLRCAGGNRPLLAQQPRGDEEWFKRIDKNGNGKLSREEVKAGSYQFATAVK